MAYPVWPHEKFIPQEELWTIQGGSIDGGQPAIGASSQRSVFMGGGLTVATLKDIHLRTRQQIAAWKVIEAQLDNGANSIIVPCREFNNSPLLIPRRKSLVPHSDNTPFSDQTQYVSQKVISSTDQAMDFRATLMKFRLKGGRPLIGAELFSFKHPTIGWRIYRISTVEVIEEIEDGFYYEAKFRVPLREDVPSGTEIIWDKPQCLMSLAEPDGMSAPIRLNRFLDASLTFVEDHLAFEAWL